MSESPGFGINDRRHAHRNPLVSGAKSTASKITGPEVLEAMLTPGPVVITVAWYHGAFARRRVSGTEIMIIALLLAIGGALVVGAAALASLTLLPAMLGFLGPKVLRRGERTRLARQGRQVEQAGGFWLRWAERLGRRPRIPGAAGRCVRGP